MKANLDINTTEFSLKVLSLIPRDSYVTAQDIKAKLQKEGIYKSLRSLQRQLKYITKTFKKNIDCDSSSKTYRYKRSGASLDGLSVQESLFIILAKEHLKNLLPIEVQKDLDNFFKKAASSLNATNSRLASQWRKKTCVISETVQRVQPKIQDNVFEQITNALYYNRWLYISYQDAKGKIIETDAMPLGMLQQGQRLYLVCRYRGTVRKRSLLFSRFLSARMLDESFKRPSDFDFLTYADKQSPDIRVGEVRLSFKMKKDQAFYVKEAPLSEDQTSEDQDDYVLFKATVTDSLSLRRWLLSYGDTIWDVRPKRLLSLNISKK